MTDPDHDDGRCNVAQCGRCAPLCCARMEHGGWCVLPDGHGGVHDGIGQQYEPTRRTLTAIELADKRAKGRAVR